MGKAGVLAYYYKAYGSGVPDSQNEGFYCNYSSKEGKPTSNEVCLALGWEERPHGECYAGNDTALKKSCYRAP